MVYPNVEDLALDYYFEDLDKKIFEIARKKNKTERSLFITNNLIHLWNILILYTPSSLSGSIIEELKKIKNDEQFIELLSYIDSDLFYYVIDRGEDTNEKKSISHFLIEDCLNEYPLNFVKFTNFYNVSDACKIFEKIEKYQNETTSGQTILKKISEQFPRIKNLEKYIK